MEKKLYRSHVNKKVCGVCGGIGEYFDIDPTLVRISWLIFIACGAGLLVYFLCALIMPQHPQRTN